jgi:Xaa-Pro dipeptidase
MLYADNPVAVAPGMVIFVHIIIFDSARNLAMSLGRTSLIGETGAEPLSQAPLDLAVV